MSVLSPLSREISAKIVYYGPGLSGKTTSLQQIHRAVRPERRGDLVSLATETDRTIFFDFLPVRVERVRGMAVRFQLYTVPGQVFYSATRKVVLNGADGVVFVADSQPSSKDANLESLEGLRANLAEQGVDLATFPLVFQYNKQDLHTALGEDEMAALLNPGGAPQVCTSAVRGTGVLQALKEVSRLVIRALYDAAPAQERSSSPAATIPAAAKSEWFKDAPDGESIAGRVASMTRAEPLVDLAEPAAKPDDGEAGPATASDRPGAYSFAALWPEDDQEPVRDVEKRVSEGDHIGAVLIASQALADLLEALPGPESDDGPAAKATLLGLDGREYLKLCRLATLPRESIDPRDALFALHMLISARIKATNL